ncbi:unnamed protein product [Closterium sp. NIES-53]
MLRCSLRCPQLKSKISSATSAVRQVSSLRRLSRVFPPPHCMCLACFSSPALQLKNKINSATSAVKSLFGQEDGKPDTAVSEGGGGCAVRRWGEVGVGVGMAMERGWGGGCAEVGRVERTWGEVVRGGGRWGEVEKLEQLKERMVMVREIFRDQKATEFIIVTIPTIMAINESARLLKSLEVEGVPVKRLIVNQILPKSNSDCKFCNIKRKLAYRPPNHSLSRHPPSLFILPLPPCHILAHLACYCLVASTSHTSLPQDQQRALDGMEADKEDQQRALDIVEADRELSHLRVIQSPLFDLEIRGVPALKFMGDLVWR